MLQSLPRRRNLQDLNGRQLAQHLQRKASLQQMSDMPGSLPNTITELLLMAKARDLDQATEGHSNVGPQDKQVDTIKTMDRVGLMVRSPRAEEISVKSNELTRGVTHS